MTTTDDTLTAIQAVLDTPEAHPILDRAVRLYLAGAVSNIDGILDCCKDAAAAVALRYPELEASTLTVLIGELIPRAGEGWRDVLDARPLVN